VGGIKGGGAELTARGRTALDVYEKVRRTLVAAAGAALQQAVNPSVETTPCVHLAAAISLQEVLGELLAEYALRQPTVRVRAVFGASNELAEHVLAGAPCDIFISAESAEVERLDAARLLAPHSRCTVAANGLAAIALSGRKGIQKVTDLLSPEVKHVALAEPACPLGRYSHHYLQTAGVYESLLPKVLHVTNSRAVPSAVLSGATDVGLAFASDAVQFDECQTLFRVPTSTVAAKYIAAIVNRGGQQTEATALLDFLNSKTADRCFRHRGFRRAR
jgi:molybdate transport system substrate-binding protein